MYTDSEESENEEPIESDRYIENNKNFHKGFVSGWDDDDDGVEEETEAELRGYTTNL